MRRLVWLLAVLAAAAVLVGCGSPSQRPPQIHRQHQRSKLAPEPVAAGPHRLFVGGTVGAPVVGDILSSGGGQWSNNPTSFTYQWRDCDAAGANCANAAGSPSDQALYTVVSGDVGKTIRVVVTATGPGGAHVQTTAQTGVVSSGGSGGGISVSGTSLVVSSQPVVLHGVDRAGAEYACVGTTGTNGYGVFDNDGDNEAGGNGPTNDSLQLAHMQTWTKPDASQSINTVEIGLNEDCWLGINSTTAAYSGANYRNAIATWVTQAEADGFYPIISLFWSAPGSTIPVDGSGVTLSPMPDNDHTPALWQSVANTFKNDPNVIFRLQEEPYPAANADTNAAWDCWKYGDHQYDTSNTLTPVTNTSHCSESYSTVGMQSLVSIIRGTGARNVIQVPGVQYGNSMTSFLSATACGGGSCRITDSLDPPQLMGAVDAYPGTPPPDGPQGCSDVACYNAKYLPVMGQMPFMAGELGDDAGGGSYMTQQVDTLMTWLDGHGGSYNAWAWDTGTTDLLNFLTSYSSATPRAPWGTDYQAHIAAYPYGATPMVIQNANVTASGTSISTPANMIGTTPTLRDTGGSCSGNTCTLNLDLNSIAAANRHQMVVAFYNEDSYFEGSAPGVATGTYGVPSGYNLQINPSSSSTAPTSGWVTPNTYGGTNAAPYCFPACTSSTNQYAGRMFVLDVQGDRWLRFQVTGSNGNGVSYHLDLYTANSGTDDSFITVGDSITNDDMSHYGVSACHNASNCTLPAFMDAVHASYSKYEPVQINAGYPGLASGDMNAADSGTGSGSIFQNLLAQYPGHFVTYAMGTNDQNNGISSGYAARAEGQIDQIIAAGKVPVLSQSIPYGKTAPLTADAPTTSGTVNYQLANSVLPHYSFKVLGADEWPYFLGKAGDNTYWLDQIHPSLYKGAEQYRLNWVSAVLANIYAHSP